jgi:uncharacterized GH25 family protein
MNTKAHWLIRLGIFLVIVVAGPTRAHDFWIEARPFYTAPGETVELSIHVGNEFVGDSLPNIVNWYTDFSLYQNGQRSDVPGEMGRDPAGYLKTTRPDTYLIGYQSDFINVDIDSDTFKNYLQEEGLLDALQEYNSNFDTSKDVSERYIRHAKVLLQAGDKLLTPDWSRVIGYQLELVPLLNPYQLQVGATLPLRLLYQNKPLAGIQVAAFSKASPEHLQKMSTNHNGEVTIELNDMGPWLVKAVKIKRLDETDVQWQSHWASLTFAVD